MSGFIPPKPPARNPNWPPPLPPPDRIEVDGIGNGGKVFVFCILIVALCLLSHELFGQDRIPVKARDYKLTIRNEYRRSFGMNGPEDAAAIGAGTIHQESMWRPQAQSAYAKGLTQFTDTSWNWIREIDPEIDRIGDVWNPYAAIRAMATFHLFLWKRVPPSVDDEARWAFCLSSYNGGAGNLNKDIALCRSTPGCSPARWWGNVELHSRRAPQFMKENRDYPRKILLRWQPLYAGAGF